MSKYVGLHVHSEHSHLDGFSKVEQMAKRAKDLGQSAVAITDHGEVGGHLLFSKACKEQGVKPILGMEGYWVPDISEKKEHKNSHITLLAANDQGLRNLWAWSSIAYEDKYHHYRPLADPALMREYGEGIYASDGCLLTDFGRAVEKGDDLAARQYIATLLGIFGERFFMELHTFQIIDATSDEDKALNAKMTALNQAKVDLANDFGVPLVVVNDAHYAPPSDWKNHRLVWEMNVKGKGDQADSRSQAADWMMDDAELIYWMGQHGISRSITEEAIRNTSIIAEQCNAEVTTKMEMPRVTSSDHEDLKLFLDMVGQGFKDKVERAGLPTEVYFPRMEEEVRLIVSKGFHGYFNIVADLTRAAKSGRYIQYSVPGSALDPLLIGPGRGSAGGSLVAYLMDITSLDPIKYGLLFSRFLTPGRKGFPDIDVDVPQSKRPEIKEYLAARHGPDHVCGIGTRSRSGPKATLKDLCRAMKIDFKDTLEMSKHIEEVESLMAEAITDDLDAEGPTWDEILSKTKGELNQWARKYPELFERMEDLVGLVRQAGTHAAGVLIASEPLLGALPTRVKQGTRATQFDMWEVEELGALKLDALGIRHLDTLMAARQLVQDRHGIWLDYEHFTDDQYNDPAIWPQMDRGETLGIFQLETPGGTRSAMQFKPRTMEEVADLASVNRPGVIDAGLLPVYMKRREGKEAPTYDHPLMEEIVGNTYGILVYQEQMLKAAQDLAGFTPDEADDMRKFIGKKQMDKLLAMETKFVDGCLANDDFHVVDLSEDQLRKVAARIWTSISAAGRYAFNKSHAVGYAMIASWEIWTKHYYPEEFLVALMATDSERINLYIKDARRRGISILPPDINRSSDKFTILGKEIRYGLDTVRGVGKAAVKDIKRHQPFSSLRDYLERTDSRGGNKKNVIEALIKIGAFDTIPAGDEMVFDSNLSHRGQVLNAYHNHSILQRVAPNKLAGMSFEDRIIHVGKWRQKHRDDDGYRDEFFLPNFDNEDTIAEIEKHYVGNYITSDPMDKYANMIESTCIKHPDEYESYKKNKEFFVGGTLTRVKPHTTKTKKPMAFLTVSWNDQDFSILAFPESWQKFKSVLDEGAPVVCSVIKLDKGSCHLSMVHRLDRLEDS